jgi:hypothetical protein
MCGRFLLPSSGDSLAKHFGLDDTPSLLPRYDIAPSQPVSAVRQAEGMEPTNKQAECLLHRGVLGRENAFGCSSEAGYSFEERMLTVVQTRRLQGRPVLSFL